MKSLKSLTMLIVILLITLSPLSANGIAEQELPTPSVVTALDSFQDQVEVKTPIENIAIIGKAALMPADALYLFPEVKQMNVTMAKTDQGLGDFFTLVVPKEKETKRLGQTISAEEILAINPDIILTKSRNKKDIEKLIGQFDIPIFALDLETTDSWKKEIIQLGILLNNEKRGEEIVQEITNREMEVSKRIADVQKPTVLVLQGNNNNGVTSFSIAPKNWMQGELVEKAGGEAVVLPGNDSGWSVVSFEQIAVWNPDYIIIVSYKTKGNSFSEQIYSSSEWKELKSVKNGNVYLAPSDVVNYFQPNSRWILALQWLGVTLHPSLFSDVNMSDEVASFYKEMYGISNQVILDELVNKYKSSLK